MVQGREGGQDGGSIKLAFKAGHVVASRRLTPRHFWLCLLGQRGLCEKPHKDAEAGSWKWLEDPDGLRPEDQLQPHDIALPPVPQC